MNMENMNHHDHGQHETMTMKTMNHHAWHLPPWTWKHKPPWLWKTWNHDHGKPEPPWLWKTQTTTLENMNHHEHGKKQCTWFEARPCRKTCTWKTYEPPWTCMNHHVHGKMENLSMKKKKHEPPCTCMETHDMTCHSWGPDFSAEIQARKIQPEQQQHSIHQKCKQTTPQQLI